MSNISSLPAEPISRAIRHEIEAIRGNWLWFVVLGVGLIVLGTVALGSPVVASLATAMVLGWLLVFSGIFEVAGSFFCRGWSGMLIVLLSGILAVVVGMMMVSNPAVASAALTLLLTSYLFVEGLFKITGASAYRHATWGWVLLSGVIDVVLALMILAGYPGTGLTVLGVLVGINFIFRGIFWVMLGLSVKKLPVK